MGRHKNTLVLQYFNKLTDVDVECQLCQTKLICRSNTWNLYRHLGKVHGIPRQDLYVNKDKINDTQKDNNNNTSSYNVSPLNSLKHSESLAISSNEEKPSSSSKEKSKCRKSNAKKTAPPRIQVDETVVFMQSCLDSLLSEPNEAPKTNLEDDSVSFLLASGKQNTASSGTYKNMEKEARSGYDKTNASRAALHQAALPEPLLSEPIDGTCGANSHFSDTAGQVDSVPLLPASGKQKETYPNSKEDLAKEETKAKIKMLNELTELTAARRVLVELQTLAVLRQLKK